MSRLSREKKREQNHAGRPAAAVVAPLDVHVRAGGPATIGGVPVAAADGEEIQHAVLGHLHRIALATGHPVLASVHDERIGYVVPLRIDPDGSSHFTAEPLRTPASPAERHPERPAQAPEPPAPAPAASAPTVLLTPVGPAPTAAPSVSSGQSAAPPAPSAPAAPASVTPVPAAPAPVPPDAPESRRDRPTHLLRQVHAPEAEYDTPRDDPSFPPRTPGQAPGTVVAPTGVFGPPPAMDPLPEAGPTAAPDPAPYPSPRPTPASEPGPASAPEPGPAPASEPGPKPLITPDLEAQAEADPDPKPTPARGFDAVAEAVLGEDPRTLPGDGGAPALLGEPMAQINEAVRAGRIEVAAGLAERTVLEASGTLGPEHPEVLRLRELSAYIAYLAGDPLRAFHVSLDLARIRRRARDGEAAYGNVQSAAAAWRAVRDPLQGLNLGTELLGLWTELTTEDGPAADDVEQLESARARMVRLAERARRSGM
ncbi:tetratricopeptide repeat protein [Streptomyces sp. NPDC001388]|uniref:tetratricopeptide repeat protein n=1 Tax=Streptomyces sp. NPDC001388 TaxID=3364568 RepID=UPI0036979507